MKNIQVLSREHGHPVSPELFERMRQTKLEAFAQLVTDLSEKDILPGMRDFLTWLNLQNVRLAVASSSRTSSGLARRFDLDHHFGAIIDGNKELPRKPAPDTFLLAAQLLGLEPGECIVFEDSLAGIKAAANAGMPVIAVGGIRSETAVAHIDDFRQIFDLFHSTL